MGIRDDASNVNKVGIKNAGISGPHWNNTKNHTARRITSIDAF
jgi:hypothetical protein